MSDFIKLDAQYSQWIKDISERFKQSQIKAACRVNVELLKFYWSLGRDISVKESENNYGNGFYKRLSADLSKALPDVKSFSVTNLKYMKYFYEMYPNAENRPQVVDDSEQLVFCIPWGHNIQIINKCKGNHDKALFFVRETLENNWSRAVLLNFLDTDLFERKGKAISNFNRVLPDVQSDLAKEMTKDPYNFDFLTLKADYDEKELQDVHPRYRGRFGKREEKTMIKTENLTRTYGKGEGKVTALAGWTSPPRGR